jgi:hypothetical protein
MLVKVSGREIDESTRDLVLDLADHLYPGITHVDELPREERNWWVLVQTKIIQADPEERESIRLSLKGVDEEVEAQIMLFLAKAEEQEPSLLQEKLERRRTAILKERAKYRVARKSAERQQIPPPPPSPTYDRLFGNQIRWAIHVIRYTLQQRRVKLSTPETE